MVVCVFYTSTVIVVNMLTHLDLYFLDYELDFEMNTDLNCTVLEHYVLFTSLAD